MPGYIPRPIFNEKQGKRHPLVPPDLPSPPFAITILAKRSSGKTALICGMIQDIFARVFSEVIILSNTAAYDQTIEAFSKQTKHKNILIMDDVSNESISAIVTAQRERLDRGEKKDILIFCDDAGDSAQSKNLALELSKLYTRGRHDRVSLAVSIQSISSQLSRKMKSNSSHWIVYKASADDFKVISRVLASAFATEKETFDYLTTVTAKQYSFAFIDTLAKDAQSMYRYCDPTLGFQDYFS